MQVTLAEEGYTSPFVQTVLFSADKLFDLVTFSYLVPWLKINMLEIRKSDVSQQYVESAAPRPVLTWTVNDPTEKAYFKRIGCAVMSDVISDSPIGGSNGHYKNGSLINEASNGRNIRNGN